MCCNSWDNFIVTPRIIQFLHVSKILITAAGGGGNRTVNTLQKESVILIQYREGVQIAPRTLEYYLTLSIKFKHT